MLATERRRGEERRGEERRGAGTIHGGIDRHHDTQEEQERRREQDGAEEEEEASEHAIHSVGASASRISWQDSQLRNGPAMVQLTWSCSNWSVASLSNPPAN
eukprot:756938-Hanusia_phi.AAC.1